MTIFRLFEPPDDSGNPASPHTVQAVIAAYLESKRFEHATGGFTAESLDRCQRYLNIFAKKFGHKTLSECHKNDLQKFLLDHPEWESSFTKHDAVGSVVTAFRWAEDEYHIYNCYRRPKFLGAPLKPRPAILPEEYQAIRLKARRAMTRRGRRARSREAFRCGLTFLWKTGCRTKEMRMAEWEDVDWKRAVIVLMKNKTAHKTGQERTIPVRRALPLLRWLFKRRRKGQKRIFVNSLGKPWTCDSFAKEFRRYANMAGVRKEISAYCLRHGLCVRLLEKGKGERQIADVMGHKSTRYVSWYGRSTLTKADYLNDVLESDRRK